MPASIRTSMLLRRFKTVPTAVTSQALALRMHFNYDRQNLYSQRLTALSLQAPGTPGYAEVNQRYDALLHALVDRFETNLQILLDSRSRDGLNSIATPEAKPTRTRKPATPRNGSKFATSLPEFAVLVMTRWYDAHRSFPYLDATTCAQIAKETGIRETQVRRWFTNRRRRDGVKKELKGATNKFW